MSAVHSGKFGSGEGGTADAYRARHVRRHCRGFLALWALYRTDPSDLASRGTSHIRRIDCNLQRASVNIPRERWPELFRHIAALRPANSIGWMGERWTHMGSIVLEYPDQDVYRLNFATRPSLGGRRIVSLSRKAPFGGWWNYSHYDGDQLFEWLHEQLGTPIALQ